MDERARRKAEVVAHVFKKRFKGFKKKQFEKDWEEKVEGMIPHLSSLDDETAVPQLHEVAEAMRIEYSTKYELKGRRKPKKV